ncbi:hypothetical protein HG535_0A01350 [Zygotorulaspora mrakii]|uniref:ENTH domain-containing protein n=1 Tax=Zygotorulaspora mrakii TaxID=42260 RepID=A0A7H9AV91_ZYGMR|nr:uncharacterized protein HG535_0A01350 [Zygotorulaspora mrakii]QLG70196.1 hypothetical protein HG535_0A01350 [Zygotorulaspora mrakii]
MVNYELVKSIRKACSAEETAPKRKHVRACIVYTWDHGASYEFFEALKSMPILNNETQVYKALILVHKVIQEGHPTALKEGLKNRDWIGTVGRSQRVESVGTYGYLIEQYSKFLICKLDFHAYHKGFTSGIFEYKEYVALMNVSDPDAGYEVILDLMGLQDNATNYSVHVLASIGSENRESECKISALVPMIAETYAIQKFTTAMLRGMVEQLGDTGGLEQLIDKHNIQYARVFEFFADCSSIKYLISLINLPKLPSQPPIFVTGTVVDRKPLQSAKPREIPSPDIHLTIHLALQTIKHFQDPVSAVSITQLANEVATQPRIPSIIQLTHQITTLLQRNPSPLLAQASQLYFQALLSPNQQDIINANTNLQNLLINSPAHIFDPPTPQTHTSA